MSIKPAGANRKTYAAKVAKILDVKAPRKPAISGYTIKQTSAKGAEVLIYCKSKTVAHTITKLLNSYARPGVRFTYHNA